MFKKNAVGIFLGPLGLSIVETTIRGKVKNYLYNPYPKDITRPGGQIAPKDNIFDAFLDNEEEIIAFLQRSIRDSRVNFENDEIIICVPNRDLIVRFFEIPPIPRKDISASISFEIKKYIPFRTEEITYDYQISKQKNIIEVLFAGIKNEDLQKYNSILTQLKVNILAIEPSQFSLLRLLKILKIITSKETVVVAELEHGEGAISIIDNGIPCFSRDIKISSSSESADIDAETASFRLINEVRVSIDYFRRQFLKEGVDRIMILSKEESKELISAFEKELSLKVVYKNPDQIFGIKEQYSLNLAKALGASLRANKPSSLIINLGKKQKPTALGLASSQQMISEALGEMLDIPKSTIIRALSFAFVALLAMFIFVNYKMKPFKQGLAAITNEANSKLTDDLKMFDVESMRSRKNSISDRLAVYRNVFRKDFLISERLEVLTGLLPEGVWLEEITFSRDGRSVYLKCLVYRGDEKEATEAPYSFISNLKDSPLFSQKVSDISTRSLRSDWLNNYKVIRFEIDIRLEI